jgi:hypothetical protein
MQHVVCLRSKLFFRNSSNTGIQTKMKRSQKLLKTEAGKNEYEKAPTSLSSEPGYSTPATMQSCHSHSRQMKPVGDRTCRHACVAEISKEKEKK